MKHYTAGKYNIKITQGWGMLGGGGCVEFVTCSL